MYTTMQRAAFRSICWQVNGKVCSIRSWLLTSKLLREGLVCAKAGAEGRTQIDHAGGLLVAGATGPARARGIIQAALTLRPCKRSTRLRMPCRWAGCLESPSGFLCCRENQSQKCISCQWDSMLPCISHTQTAQGLQKALHPSP